MKSCVWFRRKKTEKHLILSYISNIVLLYVAQKRRELIYEKRSKRYENSKEDCIAKPSHKGGEARRRRAPRRGAL